MIEGEEGFRAREAQVLENLTSQGLAGQFGDIVLRANADGSSATMPEVIWCTER